MLKLTESRYHRRVFFTGSVAAFLLLLVLRFYALPHFSDTVVPPSDIIAAILDTLLTSLVASVLIATLVIWLTPPVMKTAVMEVIEPRAIEQALQEAAQGTKEWLYRGHSGRHLRAVTLPKLAEAARATNTSRSIAIQILDPTNSKTCQFYAEYRQRLRSAIGDREWTAERVRLELNATIVTAFAWKAKHPALEVAVSLIQTVSLFRVDVSDRLALITKEDRREPALRCDSGTFFYDSYKEDLLLSAQQARPLPRHVRGQTLEAVNVEGVRALLTELGLAGQDLGEDSVREILRLAQAGENPYA
jgi:hypothetical protein